MERPFNTDATAKTAFESLLFLSPSNSKSKKCLTENAALLTNVNTNKRLPYDLLLNPQYSVIVPFLLCQNLPCPLYVASQFNCAVDPKTVPLSKGAQRILLEENAGGQSELSEAFSFEVMRKCFGAQLLKTEMAIAYWWPHWKKTDYSCKVSGIKLGVSVTRAMKYNGVFTRRDGRHLLRKKLNGIIESSQGVLERDEWQRQVLHIWATDSYIEVILQELFLEMVFNEPELVQNTLLLVTVASEDMWWIFYQNKLVKQSNKKKIKKNLSNSEGREWRKCVAVANAVT